MKCKRCGKEIEKGKAKWTRKKFFCGRCWNLGKNYKVFEDDLKFDKFMKLENLECHSWHFNVATNKEDNRWRAS